MDPPSDTMREGIRRGAVRLAAALRFRSKRAIRALALTAASRASGRVYLELDYPPQSVNAPRYGHGKPPHERLREIIAEHEPLYRDTLASFAAYGDSLTRIATRSDDTLEPQWENPWFSGLDAISLYGFMRTMRPARFIEIGSGQSTRFAARAIADGDLATEVISIDPRPRAEVGSLATETIRRPLEDLDLSLFARLSAGDVVLLDSSHRVFMNSDVTTFFLDVMPGLPSGCLVGIHDIYLPDDYPPWQANAFHSEQYLLAATLLAGGHRVLPALACSYVERYTDLTAVLGDLWRRLEISRATRGAGCFWVRLDDT